MTTTLRTLVARLSVVAVALGLVVIASADPAEAHPLGNFSVNQLESLTLHPDRVDVRAVVDAAELPTLQEKPAVGGDPSAYAVSACTALSRAFSVRIGGESVRWTVSSSGFEYTPGTAGLPTSRLTCALTGPASLGAATTVDVRNSYRTDRVGWREITASGNGVGLVDPPIPTKDVSDGLRSYPKDLLSSPLDVRSASFGVRPGASSGSVSSASAGSGGSVFERWAAAADGKLQSMLGRSELTPTVGILAVLLALALGAGHAALPGHGKTVMAAYLAGRRGRRRDALVVGATVTLTHTGGVLLLGLVLTTVAGLVGETVLGYLGVVSGVLVAVVGAGMLREARRGGHGHGHSHGHSHGPGGHSHAHPHDTSHSHDVGHSHQAGDGHPHSHSQPHSAVAVAEREHSLEPAAAAAPGHSHSHGPSGRWGLVGIGIAGGLVPSPSALIILLGAIGLGRTAFGVLLVVGYGVGMAAALTAAGLALIVVADRWQRRNPLPRLTARWSAAAPVATAGLVLLVGLGLAGRALITV